MMILRTGTTRPALSRRPRRALAALPLLALTLLASTIIAAGCGGKQITYDAAGVLRQLEASQQAVPDLMLKGTMKISDVPATIWYDAIVSGHDSLKMTLTGPFGIPIGALSATPTSFVFLDLQGSVAYEGVPTAKAFQELINLPIGFDEIVALLRGEAPHMPPAGSIADGSVEVERENDIVTYSFPRSGGQETFSVDAGMPIVTSYRRTVVRGESETTPIAVEWRDIRKTGGRYFGMDAYAKLDNEAMTLRLIIESLKTSIDDEATFALDIPKGMTRKKI